LVDVSSPFITDAQPEKTVSRQSAFNDPTPTAKPGAHTSVIFMPQPAGYVCFCHAVEEGEHNDAKRFSDLTSCTYGFSALQGVGGDFHGFFLPSPEPQLLASSAISWFVPTATTPAFRHPA
jgi:hypothetical protein